ncbi:MAG: DUF5979 domain-containing protein [Oscillospiraceae bacterium]|nr:DUF5979 domain-containing protein [Oscillospiraceae bacterium]
MIISILHKHKWLYRAACLALAVLLATSAFMTGTFALSTVLGVVDAYYGNSLYLVTLKNLYKTPDGSPTEIPVTGSAFYLFRTDLDETVQIGELFRPDENGEISVPDMRYGDYYFLQAAIGRGGEYDLDENGDPIQKYEFTVSVKNADGKVVGVTAYNRMLVGSLTLSNTVENADGSELDEIRFNSEFEYTITFSDGGDYAYSKNGETKKLEEQKLTLKSGETAVFKQVPVGTYYAALQTPMIGYDVSADNHRGNIGESGALVSYTNIFLQDYDFVGGLSISNTVTGTGADLSDSFNFTVHIGDDPEAEYEYSIGEITGTLKNGGKLSLKNKETAVFANVAPGTRFSVAQDDYRHIGYSTINRETSGTVLGGGSAMIVVNDRALQELSGRLIIKNNVIGAEGDPEREFAFSAKIGRMTYDFTLKNGEQKVVANIPVGTKYSVTANEHESGFDLYTSGTDGNIFAGDNIAIFTRNAAELGSGNGTLKINLDVTGDAEPDRLFAFNITIGGMPQQRFVLAGGTSQVIQDIPAGTEYAISGGDLHAQGFLAKSSGASGVIKEGETVAEYNVIRQSLEFVPERNGVLLVANSVFGGDESESFEFLVSFDDGNDYEYTVNGETFALLGGKLHLGHGETAAFQSIPSGVGYKVTLLEREDYIRGSVTQRGDIVADQEVHASFQSERGRAEAVRENTVLTVSKSVEGEGADLAKRFQFAIVIVGEEQTFELAAGESAEFVIPAGAVYDIIEADEMSDGYIQTGLSGGFGTGTRISAGGSAEAVSESRYTGSVNAEVQGIVTWDMTADPSAQKPDTVTVYLKDGDIVAASLNAFSTYDFEYVFRDVPKYDEAGDEIVYTVAQESIEGFLSEADGLEIRNTLVQPMLAGAGDAPVIAAAANNDNANDTSTAPDSASSANSASGDADSASDTNNANATAAENTTGNASDNTSANDETDIPLAAADQNADTTTAPETTSVQSGGDQPNDGPDDGKGPSGEESGKPDTDDKSMMWLWFGIMVASSIALRILLFGKRGRKHRRGRNAPYDEE